MKTAWSELSDQSNDWSNELGHLINESNRAHYEVIDLLKQLREIYPNDDFSTNQKAEYLKSKLFEIEKIIDTVEKKGNDLFTRLSSEPVAKYVKGFKLNREEFYLLSAMGLPLITPKTIGVSKHDEHEFFDLFYYEDEKRRCYINPDRADNEERTNIGVFPEELDVKSLRPEQDDFFKANLPGIYPRFKQEVAEE